MTESVNAYFILEGIEYALRHLHYVPRIGDCVRFKGLVYDVTGIVWRYDEPRDSVHPQTVDITIELH